MDLKVYALLNAKIKELTGESIDLSKYYTKEEADAAITAKVAEIVADAPEDFNTLKEMSDWISQHEDSAAAMNSAIQQNATDISDLESGKVDKVDGKSLISDSEITRLASVNNYDDTTIKQRVTTNETNISTLKKHVTGELTDSDFQEDTTAVSVKTVPTGVSNYAAVKMIGGKTVKSKNLIPFPYYQGSSQSSGITNVVNKDQSVTLSGTATASTVVYRLVFPLFNEIKLDNKKYIFDQSFEPSVELRIDNRIYKKDGSYLSITATDNRYIEIDNTSGVYDYISHFSVYVVANTIVNITIKPMLYVYEDEYIPYEPYFEGLHNAPVESVVSQGKNLLRLNYETTRTSSGVTCTYNNDGSITLNGTSTGTATFPLMGAQINPVYDFATDTYSLIWSDKSDSTSESGIGLKLGDTKTAVYDGAATSSNKIYTTTGEVGYIYFRASSGRTFNNFKVYPMLVKGTATSTEYSPYNKNTVSVPQEILNLPDYGVDSNVVDFENGTYIHNKTISNGEVVDYAGADKIIDISSILYPFKVESGGTITLENKYNLDVQNTVLYKKEVSLS